MNASTSKIVLLLAALALGSTLVQRGLAGHILNWESVRFSPPRDITHLYLPLASLKQDILEGKEGGKTVRVERAIKQLMSHTAVAR